MHKLVFSALLASVVFLPVDADAISFSESKRPDYGDTINDAYQKGQMVTGKPTYKMKYAAGATELNTDKGSAASASKAVLGGDTLSKSMKASQKIIGKPTQKVKYEAGATGLAAKTGNGFSL